MLNSPIVCAEGAYKVVFQQISFFVSVQGRIQMLQNVIIYHEAWQDFVGLDPFLESTEQKLLISLSNIGVGVL